MHTHTINRSRQEGRRTGHRLDWSWHLWANLPENPACWALGHRPFVYRLPLNHRPPGGEDEYRWVECRVCGRRSTRAVPRAPDPINYEGVGHATERRTGWDGNQLEIGVQVVVPRRPRPEVSFRFHLGGRSSETPVDAHATIGGAGVYANTTALSRLAGRITGGKGRDLDVRVHGGTLYWKLWTGEDYRFDNRKRRSWLGRDGSLSVNPLDYLLGGPRKFSYVDVGPQRVALVRAGTTEHAVIFQLQRQTLGRPHGRRKLGWVANWECVAGIPYRINDWKGDSVYGSAVEVPAPTVLVNSLPVTNEWLPLAVTALAADIESKRARYGWQPTQEAP